MQNYRVNTNSNLELSNEMKLSKSNILYLILKRAMDVVGALVGLILFSPVFLVIAVLIKKEDKGPVFFSHKRLGMNGELIPVYKFRSMFCNAEEMLEDLTPEQKKEFAENFKLKNDPRITKIGNILRKTSLDEIPQFLNVLKGDMTLVGPRPIVEKELGNYGIYSAKLLSVKPGLSGNWQASGRSDTSYEERVQMDMDYIDYRNIFMDIIIIFKTVLAVILKKGAR